MNWYYKGIEVLDIVQVPKNAIGFIYRIDNLFNGKTYIGRKQIISKRKRKFGKREIAAMENKRLKKWEWVSKEMKGWKEYTGSNDNLNRDIGDGHKISKQIIRFCNTKKQLTYWENHYLYCNDVLQSDDYYNGNISAKFFAKDLKDEQ